MTRCICCFASTLLFVMLFGHLVSETSFAQDEKNGEPEFKMLFDGTSLKNFRGYSQEEITGWNIVDGMFRVAFANCARLPAAWVKDGTQLAYA